MKKVILSKLLLIKATWETPPVPTSPHYPAFKAAYEEFVRGYYVDLPVYKNKRLPYADLDKSEELIQAEFGHQLELKEQPNWIEGGKLFAYQLEGMKLFLFRMV
jgi:hypothetical protein